MLKSMTGYGKAICELDKARYIIEIKSLNSKQLDLNTRMPLAFKDKEMDIRNLVSRELVRGKIDIYIEIENLVEEPKAKINEAIVKDYFEQLKNIAYDLKLKDNEQLLQIAIRLPDTMKREKEEIGEKEWATIHQTITEAVKNLDNHRINEGSVLEKDILKRVEIIFSKLEKVSDFEKTRIDCIRNRIDKGLNDIMNGDSNIDKDRFEQEMIYYIEKLDITEEKVRLKNHCNYFTDCIKEKDTGKKLGFIAQEMLREINTIGSKANDSDIQALVVEMKDELEKIKEQLMNVL